jgi:hypothetical protein
VPDRTNQPIVVFSREERRGLFRCAQERASRRTVPKTPAKEARRTGVDHSLARYEKISTSRG